MSFWRGSAANKMIVIGAVLFLLVVIGGYSQSWYFGWVGVGDYIKPAGVEERGKTLWDWLDLLIIPAVLAIAAFYLNRAERAAERKIAGERAKAEREAAADRARETALQTYLDRLAELLLEKNLRKSGEEDDVRVVARARTLTTLRELDAGRKGTLVKFLHEARLIETDGGVIEVQNADLIGANLAGADLSGAYLIGVNLAGAGLSRTRLSRTYLSGAKLIGADLSGVDLSRAALSRADLSGARLSGAKLSGADLSEADLSGAKLNGAELSGADLSRANLRRADLSEANLSEADLSEADLSWAKLSGAESSQKTVWPAGFNPKEAGVIFEEEAFQ